VARATVAARREMVAGTLGRRRARGERGAAGEGTEFRVRPLGGAWDWGLLGGGRLVGGVFVKVVQGMFGKRHHLLFE
jgi:hypothetical protein